MQMTISGEKDQLPPTGAPEPILPLACRFSLPEGIVLVCDGENRNQHLSNLLAHLTENGQEPVVVPVSMSAADIYVQSRRIVSDTLK